MIFASEAVGDTGATAVSIAHILGVSVANNRRDEITGCMMFHGGHILQAVEGRRVDIDRLLRRVRADRRHRNLRIVSDRPVADRSLEQPMALCGNVGDRLARVGVPCLSGVSANDAEAILNLCAA
ncbi:MAG: BLUF domain-containing protein [Brevundimonas sp.]|uniref:BLUF domain-containing protein n=1 Tax=Brevundimonas sp. TaxID=1871086 RepID=UPI0017DD12A1|nr:BLUF domain-containing protein [Brevundimonas sp.]MBA4805090.1 BLUF domain-containing protein [Brevundimonas sp.]